MSKTIYGLEAKYYNYVSKVFNTVCDYYNYELIIPAPNDILPEVKKLSSNNKVYYNLRDEMGVIATNFSLGMIDAEVISLAYRFLEEIGITEIMVKIKSEDKLLLNYLDYLDVDYEESPLEDDVPMSFQIVTEDNTCLCKGKRSEDTLSLVMMTPTIIEVLKTVSYMKSEKEVDVYITASTNEEKLTAMRLIQDIRWSEVTAELDYQNRSIEKQIEDANKLKARMIIMLNNEDLKKGIIRVKDNITKEEEQVDESEILDYIVSNL